MGHVRAEAFPLHLSGTRLALRTVWLLISIQNVSAMRNKKANWFPGSQSRMNLVGSYWNWPLTEPGTLPPLLYQIRWFFLSPERQRAQLND